jgi:hypothetical protein
MIAVFNAQAESEGWPVRCDAVCAFESPALTDICQLWSERASGDRIPTRDEFDLRALKGAARMVTIVERVDDNGTRRYRMRLVGSGVVSVFGESTGRYIDEVVPPFLVASWHAGYDLILSQSGPLRFQSQFRVPGADLFKSETFCAPICGAGERADMVLGATSFSFKNGAPPHAR